MAHRLLDLVGERSVGLMGGLLILVVIGPWLNEQLVGLAIWELLFTLVMLGSIARLSVHRAEALSAGLLALPTMVSLLLRQFIPAVELSEAGLGLLTVFLLYAAGTMLLATFREERIAIDTLSAAFSVYLLMGLAWGSPPGADGIPSSRRLYANPAGRHHS